MNQASNYIGSCFCSSVEFTVSGDPQVMAYVTANHVGIGLEDKSMPLRCGQPTVSRLPKAPTILACLTKPSIQKIKPGLVIACGAKPAVAVSVLVIHRLTQWMSPLFL